MEDLDKNFFRLLSKEMSKFNLLLGGRNKFFSSKVQVIQVNSELNSNSDVLLLSTEKLLLAHRMVCWHVTDSRRARFPDTC